MTQDLAIGDIHGCIDALRSLVAFVDLRDSYTVVTLGDYVDRGPNTRDVIDWLITFGETSSLVALRGNHDVMMLNARINENDKLRWGQFGAMETLDLKSSTLIDCAKRCWRCQPDGMRRSQHLAFP